MKMTATREQLYNLYINLEYSTKEIAPIFGCKAEAVRRKLIKYGIPRRSVKEVNHLRPLGMNQMASENRARKKWQKHYGKQIPKGYFVHHIDGNPYNNKLVNLMLIWRGDHVRWHHAKKQLMPHQEV